MQLKSNKIVLGFIIGSFVLLSGFCFFVHKLQFLAKVLWVICLLVLGLIFWVRSKKYEFTGFSKKDFFYTLSLLLVMSPIYFYKSFSLPRYIDSDEIWNLQAYNFSEVFRDPWLGYSYWANLPSLFVKIFAKLCLVLGEINLQNGRWLSGFFSLVIIFFAYFLYKEVFKKSEYAFFGALLLGTQQFFVAMSRTAQFNQISLLFIILCSWTTLVAFRKKSLWYFYVAGIISGISLYGVGSSKVALFILTIHFICLFIFKIYNSRKELITFFSIWVFGVVLCSAPLVINTIWRNGNSDPYEYQKRQLIFFSQNSKFKLNRNFTEIYLKNVKNSLTSFYTINLPDSSGLYMNPGKSFFDLISVVLIFSGIVVSTYELRNKKNTCSNLLVILGFFFIWGCLTFLFNRAPHYIRMSVILPFCIYFIILYLKVFLETDFVFIRQGFKLIIFMLTIIAIIFLNISSYLNYLEYDKYQQTSFLRYFLEKNEQKHLGISQVYLERNLVQNHAYDVKVMEGNLSFLFKKNFVFNYYDSNNFKDFNPPKDFIILTKNFSEKQLLSVIGKNKVEIERVFFEEPLQAVSIVSE